MDELAELQKVFIELVDNPDKPIPDRFTNDCTPLLVAAVVLYRQQQSKIAQVRKSIEKSVKLCNFGAE